MLFNGFTELLVLIECLPIFYKQRDNNFYPAWAFTIPSWILLLPYSTVEAVIRSCVVYYTVGLDPDVGRFFWYMLLLLLIHQMAIGLFRLIVSLSRSMIVANTFGTFGLILMFLLGGFIFSKGDIGPWWAWAYWLLPLSYGQNAISVNEFLAPR